LRKESTLLTVCSYDEDSIYVEQIKIHIFGKNLVNLFFTCWEVFILDRVVSDLRVIMDNKMSFAIHIDVTVEKVSAMIGLKRTFKLLGVLIS
jgi:hypothetical protein